jgi:thioesterase domain-containing protein/acyl carrier protein
MVPSHIVVLKRLPLNASGKIDRRTLPDPVKGAETRQTRHEPPATETERQLVSIWQEVLGVAKIGVTDNFFDWGGHSLKVTKVVALIEQRLGVAVSLTAFFARPTIRALAEAVVDSAKSGISGIDDAMVPLRVDGDGPVLFALPPGTGDALGYVQLAALLPCRFYGFNFIEAPSRLNDYAELILRTTPDVPCLLFGYSSGGNLAHALAYELESRGRPAAAIIMVDSARKLKRMPIPEMEITRVTEEFLGDPSMAPYLASPALREKVARIIRSSLCYVGDAVDEHVISADIHVLAGADSITEYHDAAGQLVISQSGWTALTRGCLRVVQGVGDHNHMLAHPHLERNAALISDILRQIG